MSNTELPDDRVMDELRALNKRIKALEVSMLAALGQITKNTSSAARSVELGNAMFVGAFGSKEEDVLLQDAYPSIEVRASDPKKPDGWKFFDEGGTEIKWVLHFDHESGQLRIDSEKHGLHSDGLMPSGVPFTSIRFSHFKIDATNKKVNVLRSAA